MNAECCSTRELLSSQASALYSIAVREEAFFPSPTTKDASYQSVTSMPPYHAATSARPVQTLFL